ncbi:addiction module antidote protein [Pararobbsia alpina]|uniref:HTH cro/C1-type domain-containing protein n=1 Tax=Pararobbsia alpina TaxID=621374 RepID=A0A6S7CDE0_9BURK|nr:addiction module antidote protein [Pararobbsia alpina]CAB3806838.1 hypothetical protein LMG28138_05853 [Pararobbsia alpina]
MPLKTTPFDPADYLDTREAQREFLRESFKSGDAAEIQRSIGIVAHARGMRPIANDTGVGRQSLYETLSPEGNPDFCTIIRVLRALDISGRRNDAA